MKSTNEITACVIDHGGLYLPVALKLAETYKRVLYHDPSEHAFPKINDAMIGDGFPTLEKVESFWDYKKDIDLFVFIDSQGAPLQIELQNQGYPVWGSRRAEILEQSREYFHEVLGSVGLNVPRFERVVGVDALRAYLRHKTDQYIKLSKYRGSLETYHWKSYADDESELDAWVVRFGGVKNLVPFLVFDAIETDLELGGDTYFVGKFPGHLLDGYEHKDKGYFGAFKAYADLPEQTRSVMEAFAPLLAGHGHQNFWSMEIRVAGDEFYFIDPTPRGPIPALASQMEIYSNFAEIIWAGANGELVEPEPTGNFACECALKMKGDHHTWSSLEVPKELTQWMKLAEACFVDGRVWFPPGETEDDDIGWLCHVDDTPTLTIKGLLEKVKLLPDGVTAATESLADLLKEIDVAQSEGIEFTEQKLPEPEIVVRDE